MFSAMSDFFIPGPTWVRPEILQEMTRPMIGHRGAEFRELYARIAANLKPLFATAQDTFVVTATGTALMEAALVNCVNRRLLVTTCGAFSERWHQIALSCGKESDALGVEWGKANGPEDLARALATKKYDAVTITHNETSTGAINPLAALAVGPRRLLRQRAEGYRAAARHRPRRGLGAGAGARAEDAVSRHVL